MSEKRLFRQAALDRLASPEQLDRLVAIAHGGGWLALALFAVLFACALAWGLGGSVAVTVPASGVLVPSSHDPSRTAALLFLPAAAGKPVAAGMPVHVLPRGLKSEASGTLSGTVRAVSTWPVEHAALAARLPAAALAAAVPAGPVYTVEVELERDSAGRGYRWTGAGAPASAAGVGTVAEAQVTVARRRPLALLLPGLERAR